ncbi:hypothetical protein [Actinomadura chibensis]|uniref:Uncharacterized protein n=1 Tax=Actinomadura chibensis TaxID=392828 RepID=A0A5D0NZT7_9ACTN|nr:hypothetical protein [Actinomadura chibensis]TYB49541.1 hypothetical protein FXF69_10830 [Actinomadura chibensis]
MDLVALSEAAAALVAAGATGAAQTAGEQATTGMLQRIRSVFRGDARATESLEEAASTGDETAVQELAESLRWYARRDEEFAAELERWAGGHVQQVTQNVIAARDAYTAGRDQTVTNYHGTHQQGTDKQGTRQQDVHRRGASDDG